MNSCGFSISSPFQSTCFPYLVLTLKKKPCPLDLGLVFGTFWDLFESLNLRIFSSFDLLIFRSSDLRVLFSSTSRFAKPFSHCSQWRFLSAFCIWQRDLYFFFPFSTFSPFERYCSWNFILPLMYPTFDLCFNFPSWFSRSPLATGSIFPFKTDFPQTNSDGGKKEKPRGCSACCQDS